MMDMTIFLHRLRPHYWKYGIAVICIAGVSLSWSETSVLSAIIPPGSPVFENKQISYTIKFVFDHCPKRYWSYPDVERNMVTIEAYDCAIKVDDSMKLKIVSPLKAIEVKNSPTSLVLSGQQSRILVYLKEDLNSEATNRGDTLILNVWKTLPAGKKIAGKKNMVPIISVVILLLCAGLTAIFIQSITTEN